MAQTHVYAQTCYCVMTCQLAHKITSPRVGHCNLKERDARRVKSLMLVMRTENGEAMQGLWLQRVSSTNKPRSHDWSDHSCSSGHELSKRCKYVRELSLQEECAMSEKIYQSCEGLQTFTRFGSMVGEEDKVELG